MTDFAEFFKWLFEATASKAAPPKAPTTREELRAKLKARLAERRKEREGREVLLPPDPPPRYDKVFFRGSAWLDRLAGPPVDRPPYNPIRRIASAVFMVAVLARSKKGALKFRVGPGAAAPITDALEILEADGLIRFHWRGFAELVVYYDAENEDDFKPLCYNCGEELDDPGGSFCSDDCAGWYYDKVEATR